MWCYQGAGHCPRTQRIPVSIRLYASVVSNIGLPLGVGRTAGAGEMHTWVWGQFQVIAAGDRHPDQDLFVLNSPGDYITGAF